MDYRKETTSVRHLPILYIFIYNYIQCSTTCRTLHYLKNIPQTLKITKFQTFTLYKLTMQARRSRTCRQVRNVLSRSCLELEEFMTTTGQSGGSKTQHIPPLWHFFSHSPYLHPRVMLLITIPHHISHTLTFNHILHSCHQPHLTVNVVYILKHLWRSLYQPINKK